MLVALAVVSGNYNCNLNLIGFISLSFMLNLKYFKCLLFLVCCCSNCETAAQSVSLYVYPPAHPYRWRHPHSLLVSTIRNYYFSPRQKPVRLIGHMVIELKNDSSTTLTAIESDDIAVLSKAIKKEKIGLGVFFKPVPGHLEKNGVLQAELDNRILESKAAFITFKISDSAYQYLMLYVDSFKLRGYDKLYNGLNSPRTGEGSGCTAYGISFLELINALDPEYTKHWAVKAQVPEKLIGDGKKKVSIWRIFFSFHWARKNEPSRYLQLYEPYLVYQWIHSVHASEQANPTGKYQLKMNGKVKGLEVNCIPCIPQYPRFLSNTVVQNLKHQ